MPISIGGPLGPGADEGFYLPGPPGSDNGDFWVGDYVRLHTGSGPFDYNEQTARVMAITITRDDDNAELIIIPELKTATLAPSIVQYYTDSRDLGCYTSGWPDPPGGGNLMVGFAAARGGSTLYDSSKVPIGSTQAPGAGCDGTADVPGTAWTLIDSIFADQPGSNSAMTMAYRQSVVSEPQVDRWRWSDRLRVHYIETAYVSGAPTVVVAGVSQSTGGSVFTSDDLPSPGPGIWYCGFSYTAPGPDDGASNAFDMIPRAPAQDLGLRGYNAGAQYRPYSCLVPLIVTGAGTDHVVMDRSAVPRDPASVFRWLCAFWPS